MIIAFTTNEKPLSRLARFLSSEPSSHLGVIFYRFDTAFDCSTSGFKLQTIQRFLTVNHPCYEIFLNMDELDEAKAFSALASRVGSKYNFKSWYWCIWRGFLLKFFGINPPEKNPHYSETEYLCTNIIDPLEGILLKYGLNINDLKDSAISPHGLFLCLQSQLRE
jgi:hypothetical protein